MSEFEQGFHDATRRIDVMESPVPPLDPAELVRLGELVRRRRSRVRTLLVAAAVALLATAVGLAGMLSGRGQAGPVVVGVPVVPPSPVRYVVDPVPVEAMPGSQVVAEDPDTGKGTSQRAFFVDGDRVYISDSRAAEIRVYVDAKLVDTIAAPSLKILQFVVWDGVFYAAVRRNDTPHDGPVGALKAFGVTSGALVPADVLPASVESVDPTSFLRAGQALAVVDAFGTPILIAGTGPAPAPPTITSYDAGDRVLVEDGLIAAELRTRLDEDQVMLLARDAANAWYEVVSTDDGKVYENVVYQFAITGELVATWTGGPTTTSPSASEYAVDAGQVYRLVDTKAGVQVVRLQPRPA